MELTTQELDRIVSWYVTAMSHGETKRGDLLLAARIETEVIKRDDLPDPDGVIPAQRAV